MAGLSLKIKRVDWLIGVTVVTSLVTVWLVLAGFDALIQFLRQLGNIGKNGYTMADAAVYVLVTFPRRLYEMFSFAALIGGLLGLGGLASTGELTALRAAGMSKLRIAASSAGVVAVMIVGVVALGETAAPWGDQKAQAMQLSLKSGNLSATSSGLWARDGERVINAKNTTLTEVNGHNVIRLIDVRMFTLTPDGQVSRFDWAKSAEHNGREWVLKDVRSSTLDEAGVHTISSPSERWNSRLSPLVLEQSVIHPNYLPMRDLRRNINYQQSIGESATAYEVAFWERALYPFNVLVLVLCAMPFAFGTLRSGGLGKRIFVGMLLAIAWYFLQQAIVSFGTVYGVPPVLANLLPAAILILAAWLYFRRNS